MLSRGFEGAPEVGHVHKIVGCALSRRALTLSKNGKGARMAPGSGARSGHLLGFMHGCVSRSGSSHVERRLRGAERRRSMTH